MRITDPLLTLYFTSTETTINTNSIVIDSIVVNEQLYNELAASSNTVSLQLLPDGTDLIERIISNNEDIKATLLDGITVLFTGYVSNNFAWRVNQTGEDVLQLKLEDMGTRLLGKPFVDQDETQIKDTFFNILLTIKTRCGNKFNVIYDASVTSAIQTKELLNKVNSDKTCQEVLDEICYELGLIYYFNAAGNLVIRRTDLTSSPFMTLWSKDGSSFVEGTDDYIYVENNTAIDLSKKAKQYKQVRVKYDTIADSESNVPVYAVTEDITVPAGQWWDGQTHTESIYDLTLDEYFQAGKEYYVYSDGSYVYVSVTVGNPVPDNTYYEYSGNAATVNMEDLNEGKDILYVYPNSVTPSEEKQTGSYTSGGVDYVAAPTGFQSSKWTLKQHQNSTKLDVLIDNTLSSLSTIYTVFKADARIIRKVATASIYRAASELTADSESQFNYEASWIHAKDDAVALATLLNNYYLYCNNTYTFYAKKDIALGSIIAINENLFSGLNIKLLLVARQYTGYPTRNGLYKYTAQAISEFDLSAVVRTESDNISLFPGRVKAIRDTSILYAASSDQTQPTTGWQPTMPLLDADVNKYLWKKETITYTDETTKEVYSILAVYGDTGDPHTFTMAVQPSNLIINRRLTTYQSITVKCTVEGYTGTPTISYWFEEYEPDDPISFVANTVTFTVPYNNNYESLKIKATLAGAPDQEVELVAVDETEELSYYGKLSIDTSAYFNGEALAPENYSSIDWSPINALLATGTQFLDGDSFFNDYSESNPSFRDVYIYTYEGTKWIPIKFSNFSNSIKSKICMIAQKDVLSTIETGTVTKSDFGYFNTIVTETVTADYIGSKEIEVHNGGFLYGGDVNISQPVGQRVGSSGAGFCFDSLGNAEMSNIRITGDSTIEGGSTVLGTLINYDANQKPVFKTVKESDANVSMSGSKVDGTSTPNAYLWSSFHNYVKNLISNNLSSGVAYTASGVMNGTWATGNITSKSLGGIKYFSSSPSSTGTVRKVNCSQGIGSNETLQIYSNNTLHDVNLSKVYVHAKVRQSIWGELGCGSIYVDVHKANGDVYKNIINKGHTTGRGGDGNNSSEVSNVFVPKGGYIVCGWGGASDYPLGHDDGNGYSECTYKESDNFTTGVNIITSEGQIYNLNNVIPNTATYSIYYQSLTVSSYSYNISMSASSSWPIEKYYRFTYSVAPSITAAVTASIFNSQSFSYRGVTKTVSSITYSQNYLKVIATDGNVYEFYTAAGYYYPRHSFSFTTLGESLGAYARSMLPTDDANTHNVGASSNYNSGVSQRWDNGFFKTVDVSQGFYSPAINGYYLLQLISANTTISDIPVNTLKMVRSAQSGIVISFPGTCIVFEFYSGNIRAVSSTGSYTTTSSGILFLARIS